MWSTVLYDQYDAIPMYLFTCHCHHQSLILAMIIMHAYSICCPKCIQLEACWYCHELSLASAPLG